MNQITKQILKLWGCSSTPLKSQPSTQINLSSNKSCLDNLDQNTVKQSLQQKIQQLKDQTRHQLQSQTNAKNKFILETINSQDLNTRQLMEIIIIKNQQYLDIYSEILNEKLNQQIQRIRLLTLVPQIASNIQLRQMILELKYQIIQYEKRILDKQQKAILKQKEFEWKQFDSKVSIIKGQSEEVAQKLREMIRKREQSKGKSKISQGNSKVQDLSDTMKINQRLMIVQKQLQSKIIQNKQLEQRYKIALIQLKESNNLVTKLRQQLSKINNKSSQLSSFEKKLDKQSLDEYFNRKKRDLRGKESVPYSSQTIQGTSSQRSIEDRIEQIRNIRNIK